MEPNRGRLSPIGSVTWSSVESIIREVREGIADEARQRDLRALELERHRMRIFAPVLDRWHELESYLEREHEMLLWTEQPAVRATSVTVMTSKGRIRASAVLLGERMAGTVAEAKGDCVVLEWPIATFGDYEPVDAAARFIRLLAPFVVARRDSR